MRVTRLTKRERYARAHARSADTHRLPPGCPTPLQTDRLGADEWLELGDLLTAAATPDYPWCRRGGLDIGRLTDDQKRRTLTLLRTLSGSTTPVGRAST